MEKVEKIVTAIFTGLIVAIIVAFMLAVSWAFVALFTWLVCLCFGLQFTFLVATGVWLVIGLAAFAYKAIFK